MQYHVIVYEEVRLANAMWKKAAESLGLHTALQEHNSMYQACIPKPFIPRNTTWYTLKMNKYSCNCAVLFLWLCDDINN